MSRILDCFLRSSNNLYLFLTNKFSLSSNEGSIFANLERVLKFSLIFASFVYLSSYGTFEIQIHHYDKIAERFKITETLRG
jgi:hypothetical protein